MISFTYIRSRSLLEAKWLLRQTDLPVVKKYFTFFFLRYPVATMLFQSLGSVVVSLECLWRLVPDVLVDTTGAAFTYPFFRILGQGCKVMAYVHYPIISSVCISTLLFQL